MVDAYNRMTVIGSQLSGPRAGGEDFGGGIGRAMQGMGDVAASISSKADREWQIAKQKQDVATIVELENELSDFNRATLNEDMYTRQGKNAFGATVEYEKKLEKWEKQASTRLTNNEQREAFRQMFLRNRSSHLDSLSTFESREKLRWQDETTQIGIKTAIDDAMANYTDEKLVTQAYNRGLAAIEGNYFGRDELLEAKKKDFKSEFFTMGVMRRADDDASAARSYYEQHKKEIAGSQHLAIEKALKENGVQQFAMRKADELWASGKSEEEQMADAYKIQDAQRRDATINRIKARSADERRFATQKYATNLQQAYNDFNATQSAVEAQMIIDKVVEPKIKEQLRKEYDYKFNGKTRETNWLAYYDLQQLAAESPEKFKEVNLHEYKAEFNDGEFKELVKLQTNPNNKHLWEFRSRRDIVNQSLKAVGITDKTDAGKQKISQFYNQVENLAMLENADTPEKVKKLVDRLLIEGSIGGKWFSGKRLYEASDEEIANWVADKVPEIEKVKISEALQRRGEKVTERRIEELYNQKIKGGL